MSRAQIIRLIVVIMACVPHFSAGQESSFREVILPNVDSAVPRKLETYNEHVQSAEWDEALDFLAEIQREHSGELLRVNARRYVRVDDHCARLPGRLPAAGLAVYRARVDDRAARQLDLALESLHAQIPEELARLAATLPYSSAGALAVFELGEFAWSQDKPARARSWWNKLLTDDALFSGAKGKISRDDIRLRVALCELAMGHRRRAGQRLNAWRKEEDAAATTDDPSGQTSSPTQIQPGGPKTTRGNSAAGKRNSGDDRSSEQKQRAAPQTAAKTSVAQLAVLKQQLASSDWSGNGNSQQLNLYGTDIRTFAGDSSRNVRQPALPQWLSPAWNYPVFPRRPVRLQTVPRHPALHDDSAPGLFPAAIGTRIFLSDGRRIFAFDATTGQPAWPNAPQANADGSPVIYSVRTKMPDLGVHGSPASSLSIDEQGRLFARLGAPLTRVASGEARMLNSQIVCLDVHASPPREVWRALNTELGDDWHFDGAPVVGKGRIFTAVTQANSRLQLGIVCQDAATGRAIWTRTICTALRPFGVNSNSFTHLLLSLDEQHVYLSTGVGAIAALRRTDGQPAWIVTYPQKFQRDNAPADETVPAPCVLAAGLVLTAPTDARHVFALDTETGKQAWQRQLPDDIHHLLGTHQQTLVASGRSLWGLDVETGHVRWGGPNHNPAQFGFGRGCLTDSVVLWPKRDAIEFRDLQTGRRLRAPLPLALHGLPGGNLALHGNRLLVSGRDVLTVLSPGRPVRKTVPHWH